QRAAKNVTQQLRPFHTGAVVKEIVCRGDRVAVIPEKVSVKVVLPALGNERYLRAGRAPVTGIRIRRDYAELFNRVRADSQNRCKGRTQLLFVDVDAVERQVRLVAATAGHI